MSRIHGKDTRPELILRRALWSAGLRYRLHAGITGRPDIVFAGSRVAVFCDGCFWHGCPTHRVTPKSNGSFWAIKLARTGARDSVVTAALETQGWTVLRFWEHEIEHDVANVVVQVSHAAQMSRLRGRSA